MDDQRKLSPSEERAEDLAAQARRLALQITRSAEQLVETIDTAGAAEAQTIAHLADRLFGAIARRDLARHKAKAERPITFVGPPVRWCDAYVIGTGAAEGRAVGCNRYLRDDGTCPHAAQHVNGVAHRHIEGSGYAAPLCTAPLRADGTCTAYPA